MTPYERLRREGSEEEIRAAFKPIIRQAIESLPDDLREHALECIINLEPEVSEEMRKEMKLADDEDIFGLYHGIPMMYESHMAAAHLPPKVTLYYEPLLDACETEEELIHEIQVTVLHEIGHHFGMDEDQLEELGY